MMAASLSFLGLGVRPPTAEWEVCCRTASNGPDGSTYDDFPGLALMLVVFGFNTLGDGLRVALIPE